MNEINKRLLNEFQRDFPLSAAPYADIATKLGITEHEVIDRLKELNQSGAISRIGAVFKPKRIGASTLAAMAVPVDQLEAIADLVSSYEAVNHNYEREHRLNLWFVATAPDSESLDSVLNDIEQNTGLTVVRLPMVEDYHIDLGFNLKFEDPLS
ncbi:MAG: Lrp/AsnC family transcriptional regulator [Gammaproteobacteria bacterium]|nr:Lrp/AsnC family transcriptional regulator [Gammaproteobacteria bacterium]